LFTTDSSGRMGEPGTNAPGILLVTPGRFVDLTHMVVPLV
jgi:hypothetical protein